MTTFLIVSLRFCLRVWSDDVIGVALLPAAGESAGCLWSADFVGVSRRLGLTVRWNLYTFYGCLSFSGFTDKPVRVSRRWGRQLYNFWRLELWHNLLTSPWHISRMTSVIVLTGVFEVIASSSCCCSVAVTSSPAAHDKKPGYCRESARRPTVSEPRIFIWGRYSPRCLGTEVPSEIQGRRPSREGKKSFRQKLKQFADIVYRFWL